MGIVFEGNLLVLNWGEIVLFEGEILLVLDWRDSKGETLKRESWKIINF